ncbi:MAG: three-Cys-motif partner protein TcmP [Cellulomonas sp.]|nr:three-Cys-motif partner protein TcmP [Cellulomonas sp.]
MTDHEAFFERGQQLPAIFKHALLVNYLVPFVTMTAKRSPNRRVWYVDGYAGPGTYGPVDSGRETAPGSPLLALRTARKVRSFDPPVDMRCVFVEADPNHVAALQNLVGDPQFAPIRPRVFSGAIETSVATIVAEVGDDPLLTFLDPFGTSLPWVHLRDSFLSRPRHVPNEILLNMNVDALRRIGALPRTDARNRPTIERLDALLGYAEWRTTFDAIYSPGEEGSATSAALAVAAEFRKRVLEQTGYSSFAVPVRRDYGHQPVFLMTLFFRHPLALFKYADAVSSANQKWRLEVAQRDAARYLRSAGTMLWDDDLSPEEVRRKVSEAESELDVKWSSVIAENLRGLLRVRNCVPVSGNLAEVYGDTLGLAREKHLRSALRLLSTEGLTRPLVGDLSKATIQRVI